MSLYLDKRQRAMLKEMGVHMWSPLPEAAQAAAAPTSNPAQLASAAQAAPTLQAPAARPAPQAEAMAAAPVPPAVAPAARPPAAPLPAAPSATTPAPEAPATGASWRVEAAQLIAGKDDARAAAGQRWLLLAEGRPDELKDSAGQLLQNMLRAARLHQGAMVWLAPLQRSAGPAEVQGLDEVLERTEPDVVFIMSRLGAQALLETDQPLGRLRGQVHDLWGMPAVVSYDLGALMRTPLDKAKAWDDLCLALQVAQGQHAERLAAE